MRLHFLCAAAIITTVLFAGCKKYEEGPAVSLRSKKARMENTWEIDRAYNRDGEDITDEYDEYELRMTKDGDAELRAEYFGVSVDTEGTWEFEDNKEEVRLDFENDDADRLYHILRLKEDELWLEDHDGGDELRLKPA